LKVFMERVADPARRAEVEQLGWLFGLVAHGLGVELLGERRERRGLEPFVALARESLRAEGRELALPTAPLPEVGRAADGGPVACWLIVRLLWHAAREHAAPLQWSLDAHTLRVDAAPSAALVRLAHERLESLPGARFEPGQRDWTLSLPPGAIV